MNLTHLDSGPRPNWPPQSQLNRNSSLPPDSTTQTTPQPVGISAKPQIVTSPAIVSHVPGPYIFTTALPPQQQQQQLQQQQQQPQLVAATTQPSYNMAPTPSTSVMHNQYPTIAQQLNTWQIRPSLDSSNNNVATSSPSLDVVVLNVVASTSGVNSHVPQPLATTTPTTTSHKPQKRLTAASAASSKSQPHTPAGADKFRLSFFVFPLWFKNVFFLW